MTNIDSASKLALLMQTQLANNLQRKTPAGTAKGNASADRKKTSSSALLSDTLDVSEGIPSDVLVQIGSLSLDDAQLTRQAFRIFLQSKLAQNLSVTDAKDSSFNQLVDEVMTIMEADTELGEAVRLAGKRLVDLAFQR
jgi:hypothetical protein